LAKDWTGTVEPTKACKNTYLRGSRERYTGFFCNEKIIENIFLKRKTIINASPSSYIFF